MGIKASQVGNKEVNSSDENALFCGFIISNPFKVGNDSGNKACALKFVS
jgi:hypothetical protein